MVCVLILLHAHVPTTLLLATLGQLYFVVLVFFSQYYLRMECGLQKHAPCLSHGDSGTKLNILLLLEDTSIIGRQSCMGQSVIIGALVFSWSTEPGLNLSAMIIGSAAGRAWAGW